MLVRAWVNGIFEAVHLRKLYSMSSDVEKLWTVWSIECSIWRSSAANFSRSSCMSSSEAATASSASTRALRPALASACGETDERQRVRDRPKGNGADAP